VIRVTSLEHDKGPDRIRSPLWTDTRRERTAKVRRLPGDALHLVEQFEDEIGRRAVCGALLHRLVDEIPGAGVPVRVLVVETPEDRGLRLRRRSRMSIAERTSSSATRST
jgi:hypothetical protein